MRLEDGQERLMVSSLVLILLLNRKESTGNGISCVTHANLCPHIFSLSVVLIIIPSICCQCLIPLWTSNYFSITDIHSLYIILSFHCCIFFPSHPLYSWLQFQGHHSSNIVVFFEFLCTYLTSLLYSFCSLMWIASSSLSFSDSHIPSY